MVGARNRKEERRGKLANRNQKIKLRIPDKKPSPFMRPTSLAEYLAR
jgi:hypothetical protein